MCTTCEFPTSNDLFPPPLPSVWWVMQKVRNMLGLFISWWCIRYLQCLVSAWESSSWAGAAAWGLCLPRGSWATVVVRLPVRQRILCGQDQNETSALYCQVFLAIKKECTDILIDSANAAGKLNKRWSEITPGTAAWIIVWGLLLVLLCSHAKLPCNSLLSFMWMLYFGWKLKIANVWDFFNKLLDRKPKSSVT